MFMALTDITAVDLLRTKLFYTRWLRNEHLGNLECCSGVLLSRQKAMLWSLYRSRD